MYGYIYMFTNRINGKKYIGQKKGKKICQHYMGSGTIFQEAKEKYGIENFKFDILCCCDTQEELDNAEKYYIGFKYYSFLNTGRGYNIASGGDGNTVAGMTEETKEKMKQKMSAKKQGELHPNYGKTGSKNSHFKGYVYCPQLDMTFEGFMDAERECKELFNIKVNHSTISAVCKGKRKTHGTYQGEKLTWEFKKNI